MPMAAIQVKDVPARLHEQARDRASELDLTLGDYVLSLIRHDLRRAKVKSWREDLLKRPVAHVSTDAILEIIREGRDER
jgi:hypothetical protein